MWGPISAFVAPLSSCAQEIVIKQALIAILIQLQLDAKDLLHLVLAIVVHQDLLILIQRLQFLRKNLLGNDILGLQEAKLVHELAL